MTKNQEKSSNKSNSSAKNSHGSKAKASAEVNASSSVDTSVDNAEHSAGGEFDSRDHGGAGRGGRKPPVKKFERREKANVEGEYEERVASVTRCSKVVKGGRRFSFSVLVILGNKNGRVGYGLGKAKEVPEAIRKAKMVAQKSMVDIILDNGTIPHEILANHDAGKILFRPAGEGTGIKAAGACRAILELAGVKNILTKSLKGNNPHNIVKATFKALTNLRSVESIAKTRGKEAVGLRIK